MERIFRSTAAIAAVPAGKIGTALVVASVLLVIGATSTRAQFDDADFTSTSSIAPSAIAPVEVPAAEAPVLTIEMPAEAAAPPAEAIAHYRVHRSPVRYDRLTITVVRPDTQDEVEIDLAGLEGISFNKICKTSDGARVACGSRARAQLVNFIARKDISCRLPAEPMGPAAKATSCHVDGTDLGEWIVRAGIGRPLVGGLHAAASREAREAPRGMWIDAETRNGMLLAAGN